MVNERQGKVYEPTTHYSRKLVRSMIKADLERRDGLHNTNRKLHKIWNEKKNPNGKGLVKAGN